MHTEYVTITEVGVQDFNKKTAELIKEGYVPMWGPSFIERGNSILILQQFFIAKPISKYLSDDELRAIELGLEHYLLYVKELEEGEQCQEDEAHLARKFVHHAKEKLGIK